MRWAYALVWFLAEGILTFGLLYKSALFSDKQILLKTVEIKKQIVILVLAAIGAGMGWYTCTNVASVLDAGKLLIVYAGLSCAALTDYSTCTIPNKLVCGMAVIRLIWFVPELIFREDAFSSVIITSLVGAGVTFLVLLCISRLTKGGLGLGDVKLLSVTGFICGIYAVINLLVFSLVICAFFALVMLLLKEKTLKDKIPFAPFLFAGYLIALVLGAY